MAAMQDGCCLPSLRPMALGEWLGTFPSVIRLVTSRERMAYKVKLRAQQAFYQHGFQHTQGRTGILIFVSLLEHRVQVLADKGINDCVPAGTWEGVVERDCRGHQKRAGRPTRCVPLLPGAEPCLPQKCPSGTGENPDELPDDLIQEP